MHIKVTNGVIENYSIGQLRKDNPNTSFPKNPSDALLAEFNVFSVEIVAPPTVDHTKNVKEGKPVNNGGWKQTWVVEDASAGEIAERIADRAKSVRAERDHRIAETDWIVIKNLERNENIPGVWEVYRQALRDIPAQVGFPHEVTWPTKPE